MLFNESKRIELKSEFSKSTFKTISAFSNFDGGSIFIGIQDDGEIIGIINVDDVKLSIENAINDSIKPYPNIEFIVHKVDKKAIIEIKVHPGTKPPYFYKSIAYMRMDTTTVPVDSTNLTKLVLKGENVNYDELKTNRKDLKFDYLQKVLQEGLGLDELDRPSLITLGLMKNESYNYAALLLADNGELRNSSVDIAKFKLSNDVFEFRKDLINESCLKYYFDLLTIFKEFYPKLEVVGVPKRVEKDQVPLEAFKEGILNAIIHRDYSINRGVQIAMYDNMIEINSPGGLPEGIDEKVFLSGGTSILRNNILASIFFRLGIIEQFGTGIKRIVDSYLGTDEKPSFIIDNYQIKIILPVIGYKYDKLNIDQGITQYLKAHPFSTRKALETTLNVEKTTMLRKLNSLINDGIIKKIGDGQNTTYTI